MALIAGPLIADHFGWWVILTAAQGCPPSEQGLPILKTTSWNCLCYGACAGNARCSWRFLHRTPGRVTRLARTPPTISSAPANARDCGYPL